MVEYSCEKCGKIFNRKSNYITHRDKKKKQCDVKKNILLATSNFTHFDEEKIKQINNTNANKSTIKQYKCSNCPALFSRKDNLKRHIKDYCNKKVEIDSLKEMIIMLTKEVKDLKNQNLSGNNQTMSNSQNVTKTINSNNNINNINNTINLVQFGKENLNNLDIKEAMNVFLQSTGGNIIANMLKFINFNPKYPENLNICMSDLAREIVKIYDGSKFVCKKYKNVQDQIINNVSTNIYELCDKFIEDNNIKKTKDILHKINLNNISLHLINDEDIENLIKEQQKFNNKPSIKFQQENKQEINKNNSSYDKSEELTYEQIKKIEHYESKKQGLYEITKEKIREELYNNKNLFELN